MRIFDDLLLVPSGKYINFARFQYIFNMCEICVYLDQHPLSYRRQSSKIRR